jgi:hypothetical protein
MLQKLYAPHVTFTIYYLQESSIEQLKKVKKLVKLPSWEIAIDTWANPFFCMNVTHYLKNKFERNFKSVAFLLFFHINTTIIIVVFYKSSGLYTEYKHILLEKLLKWWWHWWGMKYEGLLSSLVTQGTENHPPTYSFY